MKFESSVISYGSQTYVGFLCVYCTFESSVISYGSQTDTGSLSVRPSFESSVISYGSQTHCPMEKNHYMFESRVISKRKFGYKTLSKGSISIFYYVENIACDISVMTRKSTAENRNGAADFLIE